MNIYELKEGDTPVLISMPHSGTLLPYDIAARMTNRGLAQTDVDYYLIRLYKFAEKMGANILSANYSRYVVDLNRPIDNSPLYPNRKETKVVPSVTFDNNPIYNEGVEPSKEMIEARIKKYWMPYHEMLDKKIKELKEKYSIAVVIEAHSIGQYIPLITDEDLPEFSLGTYDGKSCSPELEKIVTNSLSQNPLYKLEKNKIFKGGYITRNYSNPDDNIHIYQLELSKNTYMATLPPCEFIEGRANKVRVMLKNMVQNTIDWALKNAK